MFTGIGLANILIAIIIIAAAVGILMVALKVFEVTIPEWAVKIFWIVVVACVAILAIRFVMGL